MNRNFPGSRRLLTIRIRTMPRTPAGLLYSHRLPVRFVVQPAPPGITASRTWAPVAASTITRTPLVDGSTSGVIGTPARRPLNFRRSSPGGVWRFRIRMRAFVANTGTMLVHGSQASPMPSWSLSAWEGFGTVGQLSRASQMPSPSASGAPVSAGQAALLPVQDSAMSQGPVAGRQTVEAGTRASGGQEADVP